MYAARSFSLAQACRIASVNALPDAWPALRMFAISASLLRFRMSFMTSFKGSILLVSRILARPSAFVLRSCRKRDNKDLVLTSEGKSVYTLDAEETIGERRLDTWLISPVYLICQICPLLHMLEAYLICVENVQSCLGSRPHAIPLLRFGVLRPDKEMKCVVTIIVTLPCASKCPTRAFKLRKTAYL